MNKRFAIELLTVDKPVALILGGEDEYIRITGVKAVSEVIDSSSVSPRWLAINLTTNPSNPYPGEVGFVDSFVLGADSVVWNGVTVLHAGGNRADFPCNHVVPSQGMFLVFLHSATYDNTSLVVELEFEDARLTDVQKGMLEYKRLSP